MAINFNTNNLSRTSVNDSSSGNLVTNLNDISVSRQPLIGTNINLKSMRLAYENSNLSVIERCLGNEVPDTAMRNVHNPYVISHQLKIYDEMLQEALAQKIPAVNHSGESLLIERLKDAMKDDSGATSMLNKVFDSEAPESRDEEFPAPVSTKGGLIDTWNFIENNDKTDNKDLAIMFLKEGLSDANKHCYTRCLPEVMNAIAMGYGIGFN